MPKSSALVATGLVVLLLFLNDRGSLAEGPYKPKTPEVQRAIDNACAFLVKHQQEGVGAYGTKDRLAITSMATLALLSTGSTPRRGPYAENILQSVRWILQKQRRRGHFWDNSTAYSQIHNHGYALLVLTQVYGECGPDLDARIRRAIPRAIQATLESVHPNGGFGYFLYRQAPPSNTMMTDDEASTTISQIQALRGARNAGFSIPSGLLRRAERYIYRSQHKPTGGFIYSLGSSKRPRKISFQEGSKTPTFAITAASSCVLNALGRYKGPALERGIRYMEKFIPPSKEDVHFFYYGHFYAAQVMNQIGGERGQRWRRAVTKALVKRQKSDGGYPKADDSHVQNVDGALLNTAWSVQIMTMKNGVLPIHEN